MSGYRLASGGLVDRAAPLRFSFDGRAMTGLAGDTLASALMANGVGLVGRSFKYHRPRGVLTAGPAEPNALVTLRSGAYAEPNTTATTIELFEGLSATSQNRWPSLALDVMAVNQLASPLFVAGFYYKTFMWPAKAWEKLYEPVIRRAAGLGALSGLPDPDAYDREHDFCDLLVIGAGPAGLAAALAAGRAGLRVIVAETDARVGGQLLAERHEVAGMSGVAWVDFALAELRAMSNVRVLTRTTVFGVFDGREYGAVERVSDHLAVPLPGQPKQRLWKIVARHALLASGATERPITFANNDRPGVMLASAAQAYATRHAAAPGQRGIIFTTGDSGWSAAADLVAAGVSLAAVVDSRAEVSPLAEEVRRGGVQVFAGAVVQEVHGRSMSGATIRDAGGREHRIAADFLGMAGGWNPAIGIGSNMGAKPAWSEDLHAFVLRDGPPGLRTVGAAEGRMALRDALASGIAAAGEIASALGRTAAAMPVPDASDDPARVSPLWHVPGGKGKAFVDFQHDVTDKDIALAAREGFVSIEHLKRYTTLGMATDQGKTGQLNGHALLAAATGKSIAEAGTIRSRPPYLPVSLGVLAGHHRGTHFRPERHTAAHDWTQTRGAVFVDAGQWKRAQYFPRPGETDWLETVNREVTATRACVGICDVSTLGKIDVLGPDAGLLLDRLYVNMMSTLKLGRARYGLMLREDGFVFDDGTVTRFAEDRFFVTTTTANAARVMQHIDHARQVTWPGLDVQATSVTENWSTYAVAGPKARALLQAAFPDVPLDDAALPYMGAAMFRWHDVPGRLYRLSFSGELAYEVSVPARHGAALLRHLFAAGDPFDVVPYGTEALGVMRIEKGHVAGNELNGQTTAADLGLGRMLSTKKDFIGRAMAQRPALVDPARPSLVGLKPVGGARIRAGAHLLPASIATRTAADDQGYVTSAAFSPTLGHWIGLALLSSGPARHGERVIVHDPVRDGDIEAEVCSPIFVDPEGARLHG